MSSSTPWSRSILRSVAPLVAWAVWAVPAQGQTQLANLELEGPFGSVGQRVGLAGDLNGDGVTEVLAAGGTAVVTYDGATGNKISWIDLDGVLPLNVAGINDINGDGLHDVVVANGVSATAYSRADGAVLWSHAGSLGGSIGWDMDVVPDLNGDGLQDVLVGEPQADVHGNGSGTVHVLSGADGSIIQQIHGQSAQETVGGSMAATADVDGDGKADVIIGQRSFVSRGATVGRVRVVSAVTGLDILVIENNEPSFNFATEVAGVGDVDNDGVPDLAVASFTSNSYVQVFSGSTGAELWKTVTGANFKLVALGDADGDGVSELAIGAPSGFIFPTGVEILSGTSGSVLWTWVNLPSDAMVSAAAPGDLNGDGALELLIGSATSGSTGATALALTQTVSTGAFLYTVVNPLGNTLLGRHMDSAGDVNKDGRDDVVMASTEGLSVFDGSTGAFIRSIDSNEGPPFIFSLGVSDVASLGDVNGDGEVDFALGNSGSGGSFAQNDGRVVLLSGVDGSTLVTLLGAVGDQLGEALERAGDRNGDGVVDFFAGAPGTTVGGANKAGAVLLLSGADLSVIDTFTGLGQLDGRFGISLSADADLNGDGVPELAVGSEEDSLGSFNAGRVVVFDGATLTELFVFDGNLDSGALEGELVGDGDGDGVPDILTSESAYLQPGENMPRGRIRLWSGADGTLLWSAVGPNATGHFGSSFGATGDVNGDGYQDVAAMEGFTSFGILQVHSGLDGTLLDSFDPLGTGGSFTPGGIMSAGHFDDGGSADFLVGLPSLNSNGGALLYSSSQGGVHGFVDVGFGKTGSSGPAPQLAMYGDQSAGGTVTVAARGALPFAASVWFIGLDAANVPFKQGVLVPSPFGVFLALDLVTDGNGDFSLPVVTPPGIPVGTVLWSQFWFADASATAGVSATNGLMEIFK